MQQSAQSNDTLGPALIASTELNPYTMTQEIDDSQCPHHTYNETPVE